MGLIIFYPFRQSLSQKRKFDIIDDVCTVKFCCLRPPGRASAHLAGGGVPPLLFAPIRKVDTPPLTEVLPFYVKEDKCTDRNELLHAPANSDSTVPVILTSRPDIGLSLHPWRLALSVQGFWFGKTFLL